VTGFPLVSVVVPARNEERHIEGCLAHVAAQDYPLDRIEVVVVDGSSMDRTAELAEKALARVPFARTEVITNPAATTPSNLNRGLAEAAGEYLCRVDARSYIPPHYVRTCVEVLTSRPEVAVVGGTQVAIPPRPDAVGIGIARALNNRYAMGWSRYRRGASSGPSDTVYLGAFRTNEVRAEGGWRLALETNQDFDLNRRMSTRGTVWFDSSLRVGYVPRESLIQLFHQYHRFGRWKVRYWSMTGTRPEGRQLVPLLGSPLATGIGVVGAVRMKSRSRLLALLVSAVLAFAVEELGSPHDGLKAKARVVSLGAAGMVVIGWLTGVLREELRSRWTSTTPTSSGKTSGALPELSSTFPSA
jgi:succinoglycan biosynthesis protein ExoA